MEVSETMLYWATQGEFSVGKGGVSCDIAFVVKVTENEVVVVKEDRVNGRVVKEETRRVPLIEFVDAVHRLYENGK
jgi:hypothetical protein